MNNQLDPAVPVWIVELEVKNAPIWTILLPAKDMPAIREYVAYLNAQKIADCLLLSVTAS